MIEGNLHTVPNDVTCVLMPMLVTLSHFSKTPPTTAGSKMSTEPAGREELVNTALQHHHKRPRPDDRYRLPDYRLTSLAGPAPPPLPTQRLPPPKQRPADNWDRQTAYSDGLGPSPNYTTFRDGDIPVSLACSFVPLTPPNPTAVDETRTGNSPTKRPTPALKQGSL
jgi:hypothetical protein